MNVDKENKRGIEIELNFIATYYYNTDIYDEIWYVLRVDSEDKESVELNASSKHRFDLNFLS